MNAIFVKPIFVVAFILLISCFSCAKKQPDNSLTVEEYIKLGVPDPYNEWSMTDFSQARAALAKLKWDRPFQLPRKDSEKSGLLFEHMLSFGNMSFLHNSELSLNEKAEHISAFVSVYDYWMDVYSNPVIDNYYHRELIDIQIFNLGITERMVALAQEINKSNDSTAVALQYGYKSIQMNFLNCLTTDLKAQSRTSQFLKRDLDRMADTVYASVLRNKEWMDSSAINNLKKSLSLVMDSTSSDYIRDKYASLQKAL
jgi:hypothetical protein